MPASLGMTVAMRTARETAILIAIIMKRSDQPRARVSAQTVKVLAQRERLRGAFLVELFAALVDYGYITCELSSGGFGIIRTKTLEGAKAVTARQHFTQEELRGLRTGELKPSSFWSELEKGEEEPIEEFE